MPTILDDHPWMCLLPSMLTLTFAIASRRIVPAITLGISSAAILLKGLSMEAITLIATKFIHVFYEHKQLQMGEINLLIFLWMMGIVTHMTTRSGSVVAFTKAVLTKVKSRKAGQLFTILFGMLIFIDDYLNSLVVGNVSRPICKRLGISKAKLAYLLDSTAAPVCVLIPLSSWGSAIIATLNKELQRFSLEGTSFSYFLQAASYNFYPILTLFVLLLVVFFQLDIGPMRQHELKAMQEASPLKKAPNEEKVQWLHALRILFPILSLVLVCLLTLWITSTITSGASHLSWMATLSGNNLEVSLLLGGLASIISCFLCFEPSTSGFFKRLYVNSQEGLKIMLPIMVILVFSWALGSLSEDLQVGPYIVSWIKAHNHITLAYMPIIIFLMASVVSIATGSSWSTFSLMLPMVFQVCVSSDLTYLMPMLGACLGGSVFGDHCSPISDTTILSSIGADCPHMDHVVTQLPYCIGIALITVGCYAILGLTGSLLQAFAFGLTLLFLLSAVITWVRSLLKKS